MVKKSTGPVTRQATNRGNQNSKSNASPSSVSGRKAETVSEHPLGSPVNDDSDKARKEVTTSGRDLYEMA